MLCSLGPASFLTTFAGAEFSRKRLVGSQTRTAPGWGQRVQLLPSGLNRSQSRSSIVLKLLPRSASFCCFQPIPRGSDARTPSPPFRGLKAAVIQSGCRFLHMHLDASAGARRLFARLSGTTSATQAAGSIGAFLPAAKHHSTRLMTALVSAARTLHVIVGSRLDAPSALRRRVRVSTFAAFAVRRESALSRARERRSGRRSSRHGGAVAEFNSADLADKAARLEVAVGSESQRNGSVEWYGSYG